MVLTSKTNSNKTYSVKEVGEVKSIIVDEKTGEEKELKNRTIERNYDFTSEGDEEGADEVATGKDNAEAGDANGETAGPSEEEIAAEEAKKAADASAKKAANELKKATAAAKKEKQKADKLAAKEATKAQIDADAKKRVIENIKKLNEKSIAAGGVSLIDEESLEALTLAESKEALKTVTVAYKVAHPGQKGRAKQEFVDLETDLYSKKVSEEEVNGNLIRTEVYTGKTAVWVYSRSTSNNAFHKASVTVNGEAVKLSSPSKSKVALYLIEKLELEGLYFK